MNATHKIAVISDTHDLLRPEVLTVLKDCEAILHAGDIMSPEIVRQLREIAPLYVVRGNADQAWAEDLPDRLSVELYGTRIFITHKKKDDPKDLSNIDLVINGHSHRYGESAEGSTTFLNPGSCGPRRFGQPITMALLLMGEGGGFTIRKIEIPHAEKPADKEVHDQELLRKDPAKLVDQAVAEIKRGRTVPQIAAKLNISEELAETISRMYLTHPGVTTEGILKKMGI